MKFILFVVFSFSLFVSCNEERGVISELKECDSSVDSQCSNTGNLENDLIIRVEGEEDKEDGNNASTSKASQTTTNKCRSKYIQVNDFCVMKDEAVQANRYKIRTHSIISAERECSMQGKNVHLITHDQWMQIAKKIEDHSLNYDLGKDNKFLNSRDLFISKDQVIRNFVGGQSEWVAWNSKTLFMPYQCSVLEGKSSDLNCVGTKLGSKKLPGNVYTTKAAIGSKIVMTRSGSLAKHGKALYHAYIGSNPAVNEYGVRCAYSL